MKNVNNEAQYPIGVLDFVARLAYGSQTSGVSVGLGSAIHLEDGADEALAQSVFNNFDSLVVNTDKTSIIADETDTATITHMTSDAELDYIALLDGIRYSEGTVITDAGVVALQLTASIPGEYEIWLIRKSDNFATGHIAITAT